MNGLILGFAVLAIIVLAVVVLIVLKNAESAHYLERPKWWE